MKFIDSVDRMTQPWKKQERRVHGEMPIELRRMREALVESIPSQEDGLNLPRVKDFFGELGLSFRGCIIFDKDAQQEEVTKRLGEIGIRGSIEDLGGFVIPELQIALIRRDRRREMLNGTIRTERTIIHEAAHLSGEYTDYVTYVDTEANAEKVLIPRIGFSLVHEVVPPVGRFFEEGFAEMIAAEYAERFTPNEVKERIAKSVDGGDLSTYTNLRWLRYSVDGQTLKFGLSPKFLELGLDGEVAVGPAALAGGGMQVLCNKDDQLFPLLVKARKDVAALRKLSSTINAIHPKLYQRLNRLNYNYQDFSQGLGYLLKELYGVEPPEDE